MLVIHGYKLITGEDIVGEVVVSNEETLTIKNPVAVGQMMNPQTRQPEIGLGPFPLLQDSWKKGDSDRQIAIKQSSIAYSFDPRKEIKVEYDKIFGVGIIVPEKPSILLG